MCPALIDAYYIISNMFIARLHTQYVDGRAYYLAIYQYSITQTSIFKCVHRLSRISQRDPLPHNVTFDGSRTKSIGIFKVHVPCKTPILFWVTFFLLYFHPFLWRFCEKKNGFILFFFRNKEILCLLCVLDSGDHYMKSCPADKTLSWKNFNF